MASTVRAADFEAADRHLRPHMTLTQLLFLGVGSQVGSGWLFAVLPAAGLAGPAAILSWVICSALIALIALAYVEISTMMPRSGAVLRYPYLTHGAFTGWILGWAYWLAVVSIPPIEAVAVLTYLGGAFPDSGLLTTAQGVTILTWPLGVLSGIAIMIFFFLLNYFGIKVLGEANRWVTWWKIAVPVVTFCLLFAVFNSDNFTSLGGFAPNGVAPIFHAISTSGILFSLITFRQALDFGGEVRNPARNIPLATWGSLAIPLVLYTLLQLAFVGAIDWGAMGLAPGQWGELAGSSWASGPFFHALNAAGIAGFAAFGTVLLFDAGISPAGAGWINTGAATRGVYGFSLHGNMPQIFQRMNRFGIPWAALVGSTVIGCLFLIPVPSWYRLVGFTSASCVLTYIAGGVGLPVLRRTAPQLNRPFKLPMPMLWSGVGFVASVLLLYWSGFATLVNVFAAAFVGLSLFACYYVTQHGWARPRVAWPLGVLFLVAWIYINRRGGWVLTATGEQAPNSWSFPLYATIFIAAILAFCGVLWTASNAEGRLHIASSSWLIFLLLATFPVVYYSYYGPLEDAPIVFPWGILIEVGIGLIAFVWGVRSGFATDEINEIVAAETAAGPKAADASVAGGTG